MRLDFEYAVVGAGPGGAAAATQLARAGCSVVLFDKATFPRSKTCGDGLTSMALRELRTLGRVPDHLPSWNDVSRAVLASESGNQLEMALQNGPRVAIVRRRELDSFLVEQACSRGAVLCAPARVETLQFERGHVHVKLVGRAGVNVRAVVAADGAHSSIRRQVFDLKPDLHPLIAIRRYQPAASDELAHTLRVDFVRSIIPGYAWSFPLANDVTNSGIMVHRQFFGPTRRLSQVWHSIDRRDGIEPVEGERSQSWPIPARLEPRKLGRDGVLFVGDAGGMADPLTGEGIGQALRSGRLAARALVESTGDTSAAAQIYESLIRARLFADHVLSRKMIAPVRHSRAVDGVVRGIAAIPHARRLFARWMFEDLPRSGPFRPCGSII